LAGCILLGGQIPACRQTGIWPLQVVAKVIYPFGKKDKKGKTAWAYNSANSTGKFSSILKSMVSGGKFDDSFFG
jgi:hypothetical protein